MWVFTTQFFQLCYLIESFPDQMLGADFSFIPSQDQFLKLSSEEAQAREKQKSTFIAHIIILNLNRAKNRRPLIIKNIKTTTKEWQKKKKKIRTAHPKSISPNGCYLPSQSYPSNSF